MAAVGGWLGAGFRGTLLGTRRWLARRHWRRKVELGFIDFDGAREPRVVVEVWQRWFRRRRMLWLWPLAYERVEDRSDEIHDKERGMQRSRNDNA